MTPPAMTNKIESASTKSKGSSTLRLPDSGNFVGRPAGVVLIGVILGETVENTVGEAVVVADGSSVDVCVGVHSTVAVTVAGVVFVGVCVSVSVGDGMWVGGSVGVSVMGVMGAGEGTTGWHAT